MEELLKKLLQADVLTESTKLELEAAFTAKLNEAMQAAREEAQATVTAELNEQWIVAREALVEALDATLSETLSTELSELRQSIEEFRDLEVEYQAKLSESKQAMANTLKSDLSQLIEELDSWLDIRLTSEISELAEDLKVVKEQQFGRTVFEAFVKEFQGFYVDNGATTKQLAKLSDQLSQARASLQEAEERARGFEREIKMTEVLAPLSGRAREVMEAILKPIDTAKLEESYARYIGRVVKETAAPTSEKESPVLAEGKQTAKAKVQGVVKSGDDKQRITETATISSAEQVADVKSVGALNEDDLLRLRRAAGMV